MKQVGQNYRHGRIRVEEVVPPGLQPGGLLVRTTHSLISAGTEGMKVREGKMTLLGKARARPDQVRKVMDTVRQQGVKAAYEKALNKLDALTPLGYSLAGVVTAVGADAGPWRIGQRVACAGAEYATHAELNYIPRQLAVPVPDTVSSEHAAFATVGAIALHGYRQAALQLGESACVIGLGLIGQLLVQILNAAGVHVVGCDIDPRRNQQANALGATAAYAPDDPQLAAAVNGMTGSQGVDVIFITAGGNRAGPADWAHTLARDRARIVDIGKTVLELPWTDYYRKELDLRFSRSYGPGRYDPTYEVHGNDYPIGYVRWTENRNLAAFLDLVASGRIALDPLITGRYPLAAAEEAYAQLTQPEADHLGILFTYEETQKVARPKPSPLVPTVRATGQVRLGVIGAGNYASSMLLPVLARDQRVTLQTVVTTRGLTAAQAANKFGFRHQATDPAAVLEADDIDAVLIATRHATHAALTTAALGNGKAVFVEKPLALNRAELEQIRTTIVNHGHDRLLVGFNRRFAPLLRGVHDRWQQRQGALLMHYRVHAGPLPTESWYRDPAEGTRFIGEGGHFVDCCQFLAGSRPVSVHAQALQPALAQADDIDNLVVTITYGDGSVATLHYGTQGGGKLPKERLEIHGHGLSAVLDNFESLTWYDAARRQRIRQGARDKGQAAELDAFIQAVAQGTPLPITIQELLDTTLVVLAVTQSLQQGKPVALDDLWEGAAATSGAPAV